MSSDKTGWSFLLGGVLLLTALQLWLRPLLPVDETRYLSVAWEMWQRGDFLVPYLNGEPYSHKPPLLFWLIQASWALFGVSEWPARLIAPLLSIVCLWLTARLAYQLWPQRDAGISALVPWLLFGGLFWMQFFTLVQFDVLLVLAALLAWSGAYQALSKPVRGWLLFAMATALGILGKGPVILLSVLPVVLLGPWWARAVRPASWQAWYTGALLALLLAACIALMWAIPAGLSGGQAYREAIFWGQSAGRVLSSFAHRNPWWSYLWWLPLMWLPWVIWPALWRALRQGASGPWDDGVRFCLAVILPALLMFSIISAKQGKYLLPLFPPIALLFVYFLAGAQPPARGYRFGSIVILLIVCGIGLLALPWFESGPAWFQAVKPAWGAGLLLAATLCLRLKTESLSKAVRLSTAAMFLLSVLLYLALAPVARPAYDLAAISHSLAAVQAQQRALAYWGKYHGQFHFLGRLKQRIEPIHTQDTLREWLVQHPDGFVIVNYKSAMPTLPADLETQSYRGGYLVVWPAERLLEVPAWLDDLPGNA